MNGLEALVSCNSYVYLYLRWALGMIWLVPQFPCVLSANWDLHTPFNSFALKFRKNSSRASPDSNLLSSLLKKPAVKPQGYLYFHILRLSIYSLVKKL